MGRGRAKAKQTKVARELKYRSFDTDFSSLERELRAKTGADESDGIPDAYADLADEHPADEYPADEQNPDAPDPSGFDHQADYSDARQSQ
jgi:hypothetical protein